MNLTESDVRAIANNRYWTMRRVLWLFGVLLGVFILALVVVALTNSVWSTLVYAFAFAYLFAELRRARRCQKELIKQWHSENAPRTENVSRYEM